VGTKNWRAFLKKNTHEKHWGHGKAIVGLTNRNDNEGIKSGTMKLIFLGNKLDSRCKK